MHKSKVKKLLHHEIPSGKLYSNSWMIKGTPTTPRKKGQNGDAENARAKLLQNINPNGEKQNVNPNGEKMTSHGMLFVCIP